MGDVLENNALRFRDVPAYVVEDKRLTHAQLLVRARTLASALYRSGVRRQNRVAVLSMNSIEMIETLAAGHCSGIPIATVNFRLAPPEMRYNINNASPSVLIFEVQYLSAIDKIRAELPSVRTFVCFGGGADWTTDYEAFMASGDPDQLPLRSRPEDMCCLMHTSGTTGKPKGCIWGQREMYELAQLMGGEMRVGAGDRALLAMPMFHVGAMAIALGVQYRGGTVHLQKQFDPAAALTTIEKEAITVLLYAPTMLQMVIDQPQAESTDFSSVRTVVYSAAPMTTPLLRRSMKLMGGKIFTNLYGQTEVMVAGLDRDLHFADGTERQQRWLGSVGHPFPNHLVRIVDEQGNDLPTGESGEIAVKTTTMFRGYWNDHAATMETIRDGWVHTGDMGKLDEDGVLYLVDRKKDMIISGGENIYSKEVEDAVIQHPAVLECAVVGVQDEKWGEAVCAVVRLKPGTSATEAEIIDHVKSLIASYKKPRSVLFVEDLPKLVTGKTNKVELRRYANSATT